VKMVKAPTPGYQAFWVNKCAALQAEYHALKGQIPDGDAQYRELFKVLLQSERALNGPP
jgi:hypothetical protein